jgi:hypothetical protein
MIDDDKRPKTLIERFGFKDLDLTTPEHDRMLLWLLDRTNCIEMLENLEIISKQPILFLVRPNSSSFYYEQIICDWSWEKESCSGVCAKKGWFSNETELHENMKLRSDGTRKNFVFNRNRSKDIICEDFIETKAEYPIIGYNKFNIGFVDVAICIKDPRAFRLVEDKSCCFSVWPFNLADHVSTKLYVEIKPQVASIGELIRQINMYRSHLSIGNWVVMTKTPNLKEVLASQNIYHYEFKA